MRAGLRAGTLVLFVLLAAAAPEPAPVQQVPPDAAVAVLGQSVRGKSGTELGRLVDVLVNQAGQPVAAVIDFGGFLGVGSRKIAVDWNSLRFSPGDKDHPIELEMEPDQVRAAPQYKDQHPAPVVVPPGQPSAAAATAARPPDSAAGQTPPPQTGTTLPQAAPAAPPGPPPSATPPSSAPGAAATPPAPDHATASQAAPAAPPGPPPSAAPPSGAAGVPEPSPKSSP